MRPLCFIAFALLVAGCHANNASPTQSKSAPAQTSPKSSLPNYTPPFVDTTPPPKEGTRITDMSPSAFSGDNAYAFLKKQCAFGPRVPNSFAHEQCKHFILDELHEQNADVVQTPFAFHDTDRKVQLKLSNILASFGPKDGKKVMLFTHWDTRPTADQELLEVDKKKPIPGADDGASGTAVLLELARVLRKTPPHVRVELLFVDGEDWGPTEDKMYLGSLEFANHPGGYKPEWAILLDMIGNKNVTVHREVFSETYDKQLNDTVWSTAAALGFATSFPNDAKWSISDDHLPFNRAGIPAVDVIDFDYPYWHTVSDTPDKCSAQSLGIIGSVCAKVLADAR